MVPPAELKCPTSENEEISGCSAIDDPEPVPLAEALPDLEETSNESSRHEWTA